MNQGGWRLREASAFDAVFRGNRFRVSSQSFLLLAIENGHTHSRLGLVIGKKHVKLATQRNRVKRLIRENFRNHFEDYSPAIDLVVLVRTRVDARDKVNLNHQILGLMEKLSRKIDRHD
jgi:ribonuclease P protein component